ncbi:NAD-dependent DNA ligase LigA, partial [Arthrospira platensis SPKY1]|nr:NAD-dependent DNA ligase LigA [Arthrospira platensis SPKY1]
PDSPTRTVGADHTQGFKTVAHRKPMLSLDNTYSKDELFAFHERLTRFLPGQDAEYVVEPKIDGLAISLTFEQGVLVRAVTRGNGVEGDDVTANVRTIHSLPERLQGDSSRLPAVVELRGEVYMTHDEFTR